MNVAGNIRNYLMELEDKHTNGKYGIIKKGSNKLPFVTPYTKTHIQRYIQVHL